MVIICYYFNHLDVKHFNANQMFICQNFIGGNIICVALWQEHYCHKAL